MAIDPKLGLVGWWRMEEDTVGNPNLDRYDATDQGNLLACTPTQVPLSTSPKREGVRAAGQFTSNCLRRTNANLSATFPGKTGVTSTAFTAFVYLHPVAGAGIDFVINKDACYAIRYNNTGPRIEAQINGLVAIASTLTNAAGRWYGVGIRWDGAEFSLWINGAKQTAVTAAASLTTNGNDFLIGAETNGGANALAGYVDDVAIWTRALDDAEMATLGQVGPTCMFLPTTKLVSAWMLDDAGIAGNPRGVDWSPSIMHLNQSGTVPQQTTEKKQGIASAGRFTTPNAGLYFEDFFMPAGYPWKNGTNNTEWTFGLWMHPLQVATQTIWIKGTAMRLQYGFPSTGHVSLQVNNAAVLQTNGVSYPVGQWVHVAFRWRGEEEDLLEMFANGVKQGGGTVVAANAGVAPDMIIGASALHANNFNGYIDELWVYSRALADSLIASIVSNGLEGAMVPAGAGAGGPGAGGPPASGGPKPPKPKLGYPARGQRSGGDGGGGRRRGSGAIWGR